jgi:CDP-diacylglycerol---serine O-phosphatidyltransferase
VQTEQQSVASRLRILTPLRRRRSDIQGRRVRRGAYLLPSLFTMANMFCGYACIVYAMRGEFATAAPFIGFAIVLDMLDGRVARMTGGTSKFGVEFDSLADVVSFGVAPAILVFAWGLRPLGRIGWAVGFLFVAAAAVRLARFNIQSGTQDKRYFAGLPSPAAAGVPASTVFAFPSGFDSTAHATAVLAMVIVPALLMVSTIRFRSFKTFDMHSRHSYSVLLLFALGIALVAAQPEYTLIALAYCYLASGLVGLAWTKLRRRPEQEDADDVQKPAGDTKAR